MIQNLATNTEGRKNRTRKFIIAVLCVLTTFSILGSALYANRAQAASFSPRTSAPASNNPYYTTKNVYYNDGYGMPNCTCYAWGRAYEILGSQPDLPEANAGTWYSNNQSTGAYPYGSTPKLGAIACWSHHVGVVEAIDGSEVTISESHSSGTYWDTTTVTVGSESAYAGSFQGYIYILGSAYSSSSSSTGYSTGKYVVSTGSSALNMRSGPGTSYGKVGSIPSGTTINVTKVDGAWGKTSYNGTSGWVALNYCEKKSSITSLITGSSPADSASLVSLSDDESTTLSDTSIGWMFDYFLPSLL